METLGIDAKLGEPNCRHTKFPVVVGVTPPRHSAKQLRELEEKSGQKKEQSDDVAKLAGLMKKLTAEQLDSLLKFSGLSGKGASTGLSKTLRDKETQEMLDIIYELANQKANPNVQKRMLEMLEKLLNDEQNKSNDLTPDYIYRQYSELAKLPKATDSNTTRALVNAFQAIYFETPEEAAYAFAMIFNELSIAQRQEYGAAIYSSHGSYRLNVNNSARSAGISYNYDGSDLPALHSDLSASQPRNHVEFLENRGTVAHIHTHWTEGGNLEFSENDIKEFLSKDIDVAYLINRDGEILVLRKDGRGGYTQSTIWMLP